MCVFRRRSDGVPTAIWRGRSDSKFSQPAKQTLNPKVFRQHRKLLAGKTKALVDTMCTSLFIHAFSSVQSSAVRLDMSGGPPGI